MSAGLASALEIAAKIIRAGQGTDMKQAIAELNIRREQAKAIFEKENNIYTFGMLVGLSYSLMGLADWRDGCVTGDHKMLLDHVVGEKPSTAG